MNVVPNPPMKLGAAAGSIPPYGDEHHLTSEQEPIHSLSEEAGA